MVSRSRCPCPLFSRAQVLYTPPTFEHPITTSHTTFSSSLLHHPGHHHRDIQILFNSPPVLQHTHSPSRPSHSIVLVSLSRPRGLSLCHLASRHSSARSPVPLLFPFRPSPPSPYSRPSPRPPSRRLVSHLGRTLYTSLTLLRLDSATTAAALTCQRPDPPQRLSHQARPGREALIVHRTLE